MVTLAKGNLKIQEQQSIFTRPFFLFFKKEININLYDLLFEAREDIKCGKETFHQVIFCVTHLFLIWRD